MVTGMQPGSDPGLCLAGSIPAAVTEFGHRAQRELVSQDDARALAAEHGFLLQDLGGDEGGVIGALAAVGLAASDEDDRYVLVGRSRELAGLQPVPALMDAGIVAVETSEGEPVVEGWVQSDRLRPARRGGRAIAVVEWAGDHWLAIKLNQGFSLLSQPQPSRQVADCGGITETEWNARYIVTDVGLVYSPQTLGLLLGKEHRMKKYTYLFLFLVIAAMLAACAGPASTEQPPTAPEPTATLQPGSAPYSAEDLAAVEPLARELVDLLASGEYEKAVEGFDDKMKEVLPSEKLQEAWEGLLSQTGPYQGQLDTRVEVQEGYRVVSVVTQFELLTLDTQVAFDGTGQIAGLFFVPSQDPVEGEYYVPPAYVEPDGFEERNLAIGTEGWILPATFTYPVGEGPFPVVLLVHGSGPHDRDETVGFNKPFRDLAWGLASQGIATLRYEKRTKEHPERVLAQHEQFTIYDETIDDAVAAVQLLGRMKDVDKDRIYVLGHSLGGMVLPRIGELAPDVAGLISLAGPTRPLEDLYLAQVTYIFGLDDEWSEEEVAALEEIEKQIARVKDPDLSSDVPPSDLPLDTPASYWLDLRDYNPAELAANLTQPMLILQGERDYQVTTEDLEGWRQGLSTHGDAEFKAYPTLDHFFIEREAMSTPSDDYASPGHVAAFVLQDLVDWIQRH
jgi:dienelactone hydrolase